MRNIIPTLKDGKNKVITFSYDDGVNFDKRLIEIFNKYGMKGTFNINGGKLNNTDVWTLNDAKIFNINEDEIAKTYTGHEIATHSFTHPFLSRLQDESIIEEIRQDRKALEKIAKKPIKGHAYAFGDYDGRVISILRNNGIWYARTTHSTHDFKLPQDYMVWHPTCHHIDPKLFELADNFLKKDDPINVFYVWGHSYEFPRDNNWDRIEKLCEMLSDRTDVWCATNMEVYDYLMAVDHLQASVDGNYLYNPTCVAVTVLVEGKLYTLGGGETIELD